ncbi:hypothetical protein RIR_jg22814.t1 [Rhizophagus irregularis DAOM 181602=DAOM 197198]|nr:hypothetical protein RhiirB3_424807 [Rhizophagus irregularis]GET62537.1 hypothetical protein RIR_jg22814.t1 [Rhizophagus irregularis DAOM 181602=DAOM 197198]
MDEVGTSDEAIPHNLLSSLPFWAASAVYISQLERLTGQQKGIHVYMALFARQNYILLMTSCSLRETEVL